MLSIDSTSFLINGVFIMKQTTKWMLALILSTGITEQSLSAANAQCTASLEDVVHADQTIPVFLSNNSSIAMVVTYRYNGEKVTQLIPAGQRVPLGLWNKIDFRPGQEPKVYRYNDFGAMIFGQKYKTPFAISYDAFLKNKPCGNAIPGRSVLELSFSVSSFFNSGLEVKIQLKPGYQLNAQNDSSIIFPNYSLNSWYNLFKYRIFSADNPFEEVTPSTAAERRYYAKQLLNLPDEFFKNIKINEAIEGVTGVTHVLKDVLASGLWVVREYNNDYRFADLNNAIDTARNALLDKTFLETINRPLDTALFFNEAR